MFSQKDIHTRQVFFENGLHPAKMSQHKVLTPIRSDKKTLSNRESAKISLSLNAKITHFDEQCEPSDDAFVNQIKNQTTCASTTKKHSKITTNVKNHFNYEPIEYYDPFFEDPGIYDDARRLSNRFEANQVTCSLDPNKWTPCSSKKALKSSQKPKADTGKTKKGTNLSEAFAKLVTESSS